MLRKEHLPIAAVYNFYTLDFLYAKNTLIYHNASTVCLNLTVNFQCDA